VSQVAQILGAIANFFDITAAEISLEVNAGTVNLDSLQGYRAWV
jgi:coproporphyrinogen III oxidase-like Fe-S oxidoreductase